MKEKIPKNFIFEEHFPDDYYEKCLAFILMFNIVISENESLWKKYQARNSKKRPKFLNDHLAEN